MIAIEKIELFCDICADSLTETVTTVAGYGEEISYQKHNVYTTLKVDTKNIFPHLCKRCAEKLDYLFEQIEVQEKKKFDFIKQRQLINMKRRKKFNSKG